MKVTFCWPEINGYMASCWRELSKQSGMTLQIVAGMPGVTGKNKYGAQIARGLDVTLLKSHEMVGDRSRPLQILLEQKPDVVFVPGWHCSCFTELAFERRLSYAKFILGIDNPRTDTLRQYLARFKIGRLLKRMDMVVVPGERSWQFAVRLLRVPETKMRRGLYGGDYRMLTVSLSDRTKSDRDWPGRFVFLGRYAPEKGIDVLVQGYRLYRQLTPDPWTLTCCGTGRLSNLMKGVPGLEDVGFVQPEELPELLSRQGVFVLPSRYDPWPLALVEAASAGLPILCSSECGSSVEMVRPYYNGLTFPAGDANSLANGLLWMQKNREILPQMGSRSQVLAEPYSAQSWATRWCHLLHELYDAGN